jgi:nucleotide-binding universal stress UspA family protein
MAKRILVPLDGSSTAESVLEVVADAAQGGGASVCLLNVAPLPDSIVNSDGRVVAYADQEMERLGAEGLDYLRSIESRLGGVPVECIVRFGDTLEEILEESKRFGADLIAVSTAGKSGVGRVALGSVAEQVFRKAAIPVLLFRPGRAPA